MMLSDLRTLGRSGLPVSPFTLGTMTLGNPDWGSSESESAAVLSAYADAGGNALDTADVYAGGRSEELIGRFLAERKLRDRMVLATKGGFSAEGGNALAGGAGRTHIRRAVEGSLRRLRTDYLDLYWLHVWDRVTPVEEILQTLGDLVRAGTIGYFGFSDVPAWFAVRAATLAAAAGVPGPIGLQLEYSLIERSIEREHIPAARELGLGIVPWSPLAGGLLTGKYHRSPGGHGKGRLSGSNPFGDSKFAEANFDAVEVLQEVAADLGRSPGQVALAWLLRRPGVRTVLLGTRTPGQLADNLAALEIELPVEAMDRLDRAAAPAPAFPNGIYTDEVLRAAVTGGAAVEGWPTG